MIFTLLVPFRSFCRYSPQNRRFIARARHFVATLRGCVASIAVRAVWP